MAIDTYNEVNVDWKTLISMFVSVAIAHRSVFTMSWMIYPSLHFWQLFMTVYWVNNITIDMHQLSFAPLVTISFLKFLRYSSHNDLCELYIQVLIRFAMNYSKKPLPKNECFQLKWFCNSRLVIWQDFVYLLCIRLQAILVMRVWLV